MEILEIEDIGKLEGVEEEKYLKELLAKYEKELAAQKMAKKNYGSSARNLITHRIAFVASALGLLAGSVGITGDEKIDSIMRIASMFTFYGAVMGTLFSGFKTNDDIKEYIESAKYAKEEINQLKLKLKNIKKQIRKA